MSTLLPDKLIRRFATVGKQRDKQDQIVIAKYFSPKSRWSWYATEFEPKTGTFYGLVNGVFPEFGFFSLQEITGSPEHGPDIERAVYWKEKDVKEVMLNLLEGRIV